ncbi:MAG: sugar ABC transporter ATP-binding protein, partial [Mesorhizobium sp.]
MEQSNSLSSARNATSDRSDTVLSAEHISKSFGGIAALVDVGFELRRGEV